MCFRWHTFIIKLFSHELVWKNVTIMHLPQLQSTRSPSAAALTPHPSSVQAGLCLQLLAFSLHTQTTSRRTSHKSEHRLRSVAWVSEADLLVSELPDIHHKHNTARVPLLTVVIAVRRKNLFSMLITKKGKCNQEVSDNKWKIWSYEDMWITLPLRYSLS